MKNNTWKMKNVKYVGRLHDHGPIFPLLQYVLWLLSVVETRNNELPEGLTETVSCSSVKGG